MLLLFLMMLSDFLIVVAEEVKKNLFFYFCGDFHEWMALTGISQLTVRRQNLKVIPAPDCSLLRHIVAVNNK